MVMILSDSGLIYRNWFYNQLEWDLHTDEWNLLSD